jgi:hypothetical protein
VAAWSKAWTVFARWNIGVMGSNPTQGMGVSLHSLFVLSCVGSGLVRSWSPVQGVLPTVCKSMTLKWNEASHRCLMLQRKQQEMRMDEYVL